MPTKEVMIARRLLQRESIHRTKGARAQAGNLGREPSRERPEPKTSPEAVDDLKVVEVI